MISPTCDITKLRLHQFIFYVWGSVFKTPHFKTMEVGQGPGSCCLAGISVLIMGWNGNLGPVPQKKTQAHPESVQNPPQTSASLCRCAKKQRCTRRDTFLVTLVWLFPLPERHILLVMPTRPRVSLFSIFTTKAPWSSPDLGASEMVAMPGAGAPPS